MPLSKGTTKKAVQENISELYHANEEKPEDEKRSRAQIIAIAFSKLREARRKKKGEKKD